MPNRFLKKNKALIFIVILSLFLEFAFSNYLIVFNLRPDIFLILILFLTIYPVRSSAQRYEGSAGIYSSERQSLYICIILGVLKDTLSLNPLGVYLIGFLLCRFIVEKLKKKIYPGKVILDAVFVLVSALILYSYLALIISLQKTIFSINKIPLVLILGSAFYTTIISVPLFLIFKRIGHLINPFLTNELYTDGHR